MPTARTTALLLLLTSPLCAQGTAKDYERAWNLRSRFSNKVFRDRVRPNWIGGGDRFWYRIDLARGKREFLLIDAVGGTREPAFDHQRLATALTGALGKKVDAERLPIRDLRFDAKDGAVVVVTDRKAFECDLESYALAEVEKPKPEQSERPRRGGDGRRRPSDRSPDGRWQVVFRDFDVHLRDLESDETTRLTDDGEEQHRYEGRVHWSPDSSRFVLFRTRPEQRHTVHLIESSPRDQVQPKLHSHQYLKPGDRIRQSKPHLFEAATGREIAVSDDLFPNPWRISDLRWSEDSSRFTFLYNQRGHQVLRIVGVDAESGETSAVVDERSETFVDYEYKQFAHHVEETHEIVWMSERDGWNHLYLYDSSTGEGKNQITRGEWVVRGVDRVDEETRRIWFRASGIRPDQDPYHVHFARVDFDGENLVLLTEGDGTHEIEYSPDRRFLVDRYSRVDLPPVTELRSAETGELVCRLEQADVDELKQAGWRPPERFVAKGRDGETDVWGVLHWPTNFDPETSYPVVEKIYAGPHGSFVPKSFRPHHSAQEIAELGFVVVQIDGMGTSNRSKAFHDLCWKNLGDSGFPDRIRWIRAAAAKHPSLDLERVGIYGGSAGGQSSTRALLAHGDFYKVAVSDCGCHDNRMDKIWWNELWMGWPVGPHYAEQSNVTNAHRLTGKLFLIVGELDRNVDPASTMQVVDALVKADKDFDLLVVPGAGHGSAESRYGRRRRADFFVRHLLGVEPRRDAE